MKYKYSTGNEELDAKIEKLIEEVGSGPNQRYAHEMIVTALKMVQEDAELADLRLLNTTMKEMRYSFKVFQPYRRRRKVSVFGSARCKSMTDDYQQAVVFSRMMAERDFMCITGAGHGIMEAGNVGAGRENSFGLNIRLPFEQSSNPVVKDSSRLINYKYFFTRKLNFVRECHAVACFPGGFGTHDEGLETLTLVQTGKSHLVPIVFVHPKTSTFWDEWHDYNVDKLLKRGMISPSDLDLYKIFSSEEEACQEITHFYSRYHSMRYVGDDLVIRLESPLTTEEIEILNDEFSDIIKSGKIETTEPLGPESQDEHLVHLPRLKMHYTRYKFGRLRKLIDAINDFRSSDPATLAVPETTGLFPDEIDEGDIGCQA